MPDIFDALRTKVEGNQSRAVTEEINLMSHALSCKNLDNCQHKFCINSCPDYQPKTKYHILTKIPTNALVEELKKRKIASIIKISELETAFIVLTKGLSQTQTIEGPSLILAVTA